MKQTANRVSELRSEYHFDYSKRRANRFARQLKTNPGLVVMIDADVAKVFKTPQAVNPVSYTHLFYMLFFLGRARKIGIFNKE